ncbi:MAG: hypothetical protein L0219_00720, partial [Phycisphaerales bacterium]|nr:hypothetical protein [Phycisphaerales bacterium]
LREPAAGMAVYDWPEQEMLIARDEQRLIIAPANHPQLFFELLPRFKDPKADSLAQHPAIKEIRGFEAASMAVFVEHDDSIGGAFAAVAEMRDNRVIIQHAASFGRSPFPHDTTNLTCDFSPILGFENRALAAIIQPADVANESVDALLADNLGQNIVSAQLSENLAERRLIVVNQIDGRLFEEPVDLLWASMASCLELKHAGPEVKNQVDRQMDGVIKRVRQLSHGTLLQNAPAQGRLENQEFGHADVPASGDQCLSGGFPIMKDVSLAWGVADGPHGSWLVVASHPRSVEEVVAVLQESLPTDQRLVGKFDMCGVGCGDRIQRHLQTWSIAAGEFAAETDSARMKDFSSTLHLMSQLAGGIKCCCWQLSRPSANQMRLDLQIELAPPY